MMTSGLYYVGDLCYVMSTAEWEEVCSIIINGQGIIDGEFSLADGRKFAIYSTKFGDGEYYDQFGNSYSVDSGSIGCIKIDDIKTEKYDISKLGNVKHFQNNFLTGGGRSDPDWDGIIHFDNVGIMTIEDWDSDEESEEYEEEF